MKSFNPYKPGAGQMPTYLAGREKDVKEIESVFEALKMGVCTRSIIYSGLRGVGKTVLLNRLEEFAKDKGIFCRHIEIENNKDFIMQLVTCIQIYLRENSFIEKVKEKINRLMDDVKALVITYNPTTTAFSLSAQEKLLYQTADYGQMLSELFENIGMLAQKINIPICFFIDEMQYMKQEDLEKLITVIHRSNQLNYPIMLIGAGLPKLYKMLSDIKSYSERLFTYKEMSTLSKEAARDAISKPVEKMDFSFTEEAIDRIIEITEGYPFFIQQFCEILFNEKEKSVSGYDIEAFRNDYYHILDEGFYKVRYARCSEKEKEFIMAMVKCGELPCTIANVAHNMNKTVGSISTFRAQLINKGIIYATKWSELNFTAPKFDQFILRIEEKNDI